MRALTLLVGLLLLPVVGCLGGDSPSQEGTLRAADPSADATDLAPATATYTDCWYLMGYAPVDWDYARALVPDELDPASWVQEGDETVASAAFQALSCGEVSMPEGDLGSQHSVWISITLQEGGPHDVPDGALFPALSIHTDERLAGFWQAAGLPAEAGAITVTQAPNGETSAVIHVEAEGILIDLEVAGAMVASGSLTGGHRLYYGGVDEGIASAELAYEGITAGLGGTLAFQQGQGPIQTGGLALATSQGIVVGLGPAQAFTLSA